MVTELNSRELLKIRRKSTKESHAFWLWSFFLFFKIDARLWLDGSFWKGPTTWKWYNQGLDFHDREIFKTDFRQIARGREDERNKDHFESPSLHKLQENKMAGVNGTLDGGKKVVKWGGVRTLLVQDTNEVILERKASFQQNNKMRSWKFTGGIFCIH